MATPSEEELKAKFDEQDTKNIGKITYPDGVEKALKALGKSDEEIIKLMGVEKTEDGEHKAKPFFSRIFGTHKSEPQTEITFDDFKTIAVPSRIPAGRTVDDISVVGVFSSAFADTFGSMIRKTPTREEAEEMFKKLDTNKSGTLDQTEIAVALRLLGKSERQIQKLLDAMPEKEFELDQFVAMLVPPPRPTWTEWGRVTLPNREKVLDVPVIGHGMTLLGNLLSEPIDGAARLIHKNRVPNDEQLKKVFDEYDTNKDGLIEAKELADVMRNKGGHWEVDIKKQIDSMKGGLTLYEFKKVMRGPKFQPSSMNSVPAVGESFSTNVLGSEEYTKEDLKEAFDFVDTNKTGKLDKTELAKLLWEIGMSDHQVQKLIDSTTEEEFDFEAFEDILEPKARPTMTEVTGVPVPNPAKIHDVPIVGSVTSFGQDAVVGAYGWTVGAVVKHFKKPTDEEIKARFDEIATGNSQKISKKDLAKVLRGLGETERQIATACDGMEMDQATFEDVKAIVHGSPAKAKA